MAITPLIFSTIYDEVGNKRGQEMLAATAFVSFLAVLAYVPLVGMLPKPKKEEGEDKGLQPLNVYEEMTDLEFSQLPMEILDKVTEKMVTEGKAPRMVLWGIYKDERPYLYEMQDRALQDFKYINAAMVEVLTDQAKMKQQQEIFKSMLEMMPQVDREQAKNEMGSWIANYFDDAG